MPIRVKSLWHFGICDFKKPNVEYLEEQIDVKTKKIEIVELIGEPFFKLQDKSSCVVVELTSNQTGAEGVSGGGSVDKEDEVDKTAVPSTNCSTSSNTHPLQPKAVPLAITFHFNLDHPDASNNTDHSFTSNR